MSRTLLKYTTRSNWIIGAIILAIMFMYLAIIVSMYDPESIEQLLAMVEMLPEEFAAAMGFDVAVTDFTSFLGQYYYQFLIFLFPMIYCIILANRLVAGHVDRGSMTYLLSTPQSRVRVVTTQAVYLLLSVSEMIALVALGGLALSAAMFPGELDVEMFLLLNVGAVAFFLALSGICFLFSCLFDDTRYSLALGGGIPVLFFVINMLKNVGPNYGWLRYLTLFSLYRPAEILAGDQSVWANSAILVAIAAVLYGGGIYIFDRRDLPL